MMGLPATINQHVATSDPRGRNAIVHAAYSTAAILPWEDPDALDDLEKQFDESFAPQTGPEAEVVRELVHTAVRRRRIEACENALVRGAVEEARADTPEPLHDLESEVHAMVVELRILQQVTDDAVHAYDPDNPDRASTVLKAYAPVIERLADWAHDIARQKPADVIARLTHTVDARKLFVNEAEKGLRRVQDSFQPVREAAVARKVVEAVCGDRLSKERTTLDRAFGRNLDVLNRLRGDDVETRMVVIERKTPKQTMTVVPATVSDVDDGGNAP